MRARLIWLGVLAVISRLATIWLLSLPLEALERFGGFLVVVKNYNAAFSVNWPVWIFWPLVIVIIGYIILQASGLWRKKNPESFFWGLIAVGALNNVIDRLQYGAVIDYLRIGWWPVFNLADSMVVIGVILLVIKHLFDKKKV